MSGILIAGLTLVAALVIWVALQSLGPQKKSEVIESQMSELRHDLQAVAHAQAQATGQLTSLASTVTQRFDTAANLSPTESCNPPRFPRRASPPCAMS